jgi:hypothetical protein
MHLTGMEAIVSQLRAQRADFVNQIRHVDAALTVLRKVNGTHVSQVTAPTISAAGRKRIAAAQRARWAKIRGKAGTPKRTMSASSRRKIAAAQTARWAKTRAKGKAA